MTMEKSMTAVSPYTWNRGIAPSTRSDPCAPAGNHAAVCVAFATRLRWVSIAPFGVPVVPPVYCSTATSSGRLPASSLGFAGVAARSANRWTPSSRGITRGQCPCFFRSRRFLIGYSWRNRVLRNPARSQTGGEPVDCGVEFAVRKRFPVESDRRSDRELLRGSPEQLPDRDVRIGERGWHALGPAAEPRPREGRLPLHARDNAAQDQKG